MDKQREIDPLALKIINLYLRDSLAANEQVKDILWNLIRLYGTQTKVAKELKIIRQTLTYRLNHAKTIHLEDALKMLALLQSKKEVTELWSDFIDVSFISERAKLAMNDLEQKPERRGRKSKQKEAEENLIRENFSHLTGRTDEMIAKKYGFKNRKTLHQAIYVIKQGCAEIIHAMDKDVIKIYIAAKIVTLPKVQQRELLIQEPKAIRAYFKNKKNKTIQIDMPSLLHAIQTDAALNEAEKIAQKPIIKRIKTILQSFYY